MYYIWTKRRIENPTLFWKHSSFYIVLASPLLADMISIRGGIKVSPNKRDPPPPINLDAQIFSVKEILDWARPPNPALPFLAENSEKNRYLMKKSVFYDKTRQYFLFTHQM